MATLQHAAGTVPNGARPNAQGMSQGTYTGNVSFSRGTTDLIAKPARLPAGLTSPTPPPASTPPSKPAPFARPLMATENYVGAENP